jgi:hypothetical protein
MDGKQSTTAVIEPTVELATAAVKLTETVGGGSTVSGRIEPAGVVANAVGVKQAGPLYVELGKAAVKRTRTVGAEPSVAVNIEPAGVVADAVGDDSATGAAAVRKTRVTRRATSLPQPAPKPKPRKRKSAIGSGQEINTNSSEVVESGRPKRVRTLTAKAKATHS